MLSAQCKPDEAHWQVLCELLLISSSVIMMLRTYAFSGKKKWVLAILSITLLSLVGVIIWVRKKLSRLSRPFSLSTRVPDIQRNRSTAPVPYSRPYRLFWHLRSTDSHCNRVRFIKGARWLSLGSTSRSRTRPACLTFLTSCFILLRLSLFVITQDYSILTEPSF